MVRGRRSVSDSWMIPGDAGENTGSTPDTLVINDGRTHFEAIGQRSRRNAQEVIVQHGQDQLLTAKFNVRAPIEFCTFCGCNLPHDV